MLQAAHGFGTRSFSLATFIENEPDVAQVELRERRRHLKKTKEEREAEEKERKRKQGSVRDLCVSLCARDKSIRWKRWRIAVFTESFYFQE